MLIFRLLFLLMLGGLSGCANSPKPPEPVVKPALPVKASVAKGIKADVPPKEAKTSIDPNVLFMLLTAELAGQRGQYGIALDGYLEAAKRVKDPRFAERAVVIAMYMKNAKKANEALGLWLRQAPQNTNARKLAVLMALSTGNQEAAVSHLEILLQMPPDEFEKNVMEVAALLQKESRLPELAGALATLSTKHPKQAIIPYLQSVMAIQLNDKALAESYLQKALAILPGWDKALMLQAQMAVMSGDLGRATGLLRDSVGKYPGNQKLKRMLAEVLLKSESYPEAAVILRDIVSEDPSDQESQLALGLIYLQDNQNDEAETVFKGLLAQPKTHWQGSFYLGKLEEKRGNTDAALAWYDQVGDGPFAFDASVSAALLLAKEHKHDQVALKIKSMLGKFPKEKNRILLLQSEILSRQKDYAQAFSVLTTALADSPEDGNLLYSRALLAERLGKFELMESDLKKILVNNPKNFEALNALGYSLASRSIRFGEAETYLQQALKLKPDEAVVIDSYGWLQFKMGHPATALEYLRKAFNKQKENEIAAHLVEVLWVLGKKDEAKDIFEEAIKAAPEDEYLLGVGQRILKNTE